MKTALGIPVAATALSLLLVSLRRSLVDREVAVNERRPSFQDWR